MRRPQGKRSLRLDVRGLDDGRPFIDLADNEFLQIGGGPALGRDHGCTELLQPFCHGRRLERCDDGAMKFLDDRRGGLLRQKDAVPGRGLEIDQSLLVAVATSGRVGERSTLKSAIGLAWSASICGFAMLASAH